MQSVRPFLLAGVALAFGPGLCGAANPSEPVLAAQVSTILAECERIVPGVTREALMRVYTEEGGLSTARHQTFASRRCPYIKVDVEFTLAEPPQGSVLTKQPTDVVKTLSRPYLQRSVID